jgi:adenylate cyclase
LAAILAADVAGYSRLMAADDRATVAALDAARGVFRTKIVSNQGRVIDMAGDSVLAVFETATGAVSAALAVQQELNASSSAIPDDRRMRFRIGVHLGDVIEKADGTVYGDGVNIAARLEGLAEPGGITVSESIRTAVKGKVSAGFEDQGEQTVKNIPDSVRAFRVRADAGASAIKHPAPISHAKRLLISGVSAALVLSVTLGGWLWSRREAPLTRQEGKADIALADSKSIAVLPFTNMSENKDNAYFADGMHEELLTQLALLSELKVVSRTSVMDYRDSKKNIRQIGNELGVRSLVEGSVRRSGNQVRVTAQLIDAGSDKHLWANSYDRELKDIFAIQTELATEIARALRVSLSPNDQARLARKPTENLAAYDLYLRHQELVNGSWGTSRIISTLKERIALLSQAVELDPNFALAWAKLSADHARVYGWGIDHTSSRLTQAKRAIERAQALAPDDREVQIEEGKYHQYGTNDSARAAQSFENVLRIAPNNVDARLQLALVRYKGLRRTEFAENLEKVLAIDPRNVRALTAYASHLLEFRRFDLALAARRQMINIRPEDVELQGRYHYGEYEKSGSWDSFDKWRSALPLGMERKLAGIWRLDWQRATGRHDFDAVMRLLDAAPEAVLAGEWKKLALSLERAKVFLARGDRSRAMDTARTVVAEVVVKLRERPDDLGLLGLSYYSRAILGERETALAEHHRAHTLALARKDLSNAEEVYRNLASLHALLGNHEQALEEVSRQLKLPGSLASSYRLDVAFFSLWSDAKFLAMINDPANNAPLSFDLGRSPPVVE